MRTLPVFMLFGLAALVVACGGGGKPGILPGTTNTGGTIAHPAPKSANAAIRIYVPPANKQASRKPLYISPGTNSLGVLAVSTTSTATPNVTNEQIFPVVTPSPCAAASAGGYACTLSVTAPIGSDDFYVAAYSAASPGPNAVPLSEYVATGITISASPSPNATPIAFVLNGVVYSVTLSVPSADPSGSNTQLFPAGVAATAVPLGVTARDSSNTPILSDVTNTFANPIVISVSPSNGGVALSLNNATCSSGSGASVSIGCAADLGAAQFSYDGTTTPDPNDHVVDTFTLSASQVASPGPAPATVKLASNLVTTLITTGSLGVDFAYMQRDSTGELVYAGSDDESDGGNYIGTFTPSPQLSPAAPVQLDGVTQLDGFYVAPNGAVWIADNGYIDCYPSVANALSGTSAPALDQLSVYASDENLVNVTSVTVDAANNVWYVGYEETEGSGQTDAGYFAGSTTGCPSFGEGGPPSPQYALNGDYDDGYPSVAPLNASQGDGIAITSSDENGDDEYSDGVYVITTSSESGSVNQTNSYMSDVIGEGMAIDGSGTLYAAFASPSLSGTADIEDMAWNGDSLSALLALPPTSPVDGTGPSPFLDAAFSPTGGAADRLQYADGNYLALGLVESVPASPMPILVGLPNAQYPFQPAYSAKGAEYIMYEDDDDNWYLARAIPTTTWAVPSLNLPSGCSSAGLLTILERGDSGPFTVTPAGDATVLPGSDHNYWLTVSGSSQSVTVSAGSRSEQYTINAPLCDIARRVFARKHARRGKHPHAARVSRAHPPSQPFSGRPGP